MHSADGPDELHNSDASRAAEIDATRLIDPDILDDVPLNEWQPTEADHYAPDANVLCADMQITGRWFFSDKRFFGTDLTITPKDGSYSVRFIAWGCIGEVYFERNATFSNGIIHLDKPVRDFWANTYQELYATKVGSSELLVPACVVRDFDTWTTREQANPNKLPWHVLQRIDGAK